MQCESGAITADLRRRWRVFVRGFQRVYDEADGKNQWQSDCSGECGMAKIAHSAGTCGGSLLFRYLKDSIMIGNSWRNKLMLMNSRDEYAEMK